VAVPAIVAVPAAAEKRIHALAERFDVGRVSHHDFHACRDEFTRCLDLLISAIHTPLRSFHTPLSSVHATIEASLSLLASLSRSFQNGPDLVKLTPDFAIHLSNIT
jgi:hypothetical protein